MKKEYTDKSEWFIFYNSLIIKELFIDNLKFLSEYLQKDSKASKLFWTLVIDVIKK